MNKNAILLIGLGLSFGTIAVLLNENNKQQNTINSIREQILKRHRWMDIAVRLLQKDDLSVDEQAKLNIDLRTYLIMRQNKII